MPRLTKSLHTVTSATRVAAFLVSTSTDASGLPYSWRTGASPELLATAALRVLGYRFADFGASDETVARVVANCAPLTGAK